MVGVALDENARIVAALKNVGRRICASSDFGPAIAQSQELLKALGLQVRAWDRKHIELMASDTGSSPTPGSDNSGISVVYYDADGNVPPTLQFYEINVADVKQGKGLAGAMVDAVLQPLMRRVDSVELTVHRDWSGGFWNKMKSKYPMFTWC